MGEYEGVFDAEIHAARCDRRVNVGGIPYQDHATDRFTGGDEITDMKRGLPVNRAGFAPARQARQQVRDVAKHAPDARLEAKQEHHAVLDEGDMGAPGIEWIVELDVVKGPILRETRPFE